LAWKKAAEPVANFANRDVFSIISVPLASTARPDNFSPGFRPALPDGHAVSVIIPTRDQADMLDACLKSVFDAASPSDEVIVVDNGSVEPATFSVFERYKDQGLKVVRADIPFNFSKLCNMGAALAAGELLVFLNNDVVVGDRALLRDMASVALCPNVGAVGARLLYQDGTLQHAGIAFGLAEVCGHIWRHASKSGGAAVPQVEFPSLRSAVTAACLCVEARKFHDVGGFDEVFWPVTLNDADLCLKLAERRWYSVYIPANTVFHLEMKSRGADETAEKKLRRQREISAFIEKWSEKALEDPFLSPVISLATERGGLR
jgi:GT2 family glycosyltransferase